MEYYSHVLRLAKSLSQILILSMGSPISVADTFTTDANMNLKLLHYPPHISTDAPRFGAAELRYLSRRLESRAGPGSAELHAP